MKNGLILLFCSALHVFYPQSYADVLRMEDYLYASALFERECVSKNSTAIDLSICQALIDEKVSEQNSIRDQKIIALAAKSVLLDIAINDGNSPLVSKIKVEVENELRDDVYANLLTRLYFDILYQEGRYIEAYAMLERSALIENDSVTHQDAARILSEINLDSLHEHQISHLERAVQLAADEKARLLFRNQLYAAIKSNKGREAAEDYKLKVLQTTDYSTLAMQYSELIIEDESYRQSAPLFCQPYTFPLISAKPCRILISAFEGKIQDQVITTEEKVRMSRYLKSAYYSLIHSAHATADETARLNELNSVIRGVE